NDLFWHLASGREILASGSIPHSDPFSFASDPGPWIDHEWLWQTAAQSVYAWASNGRGPAPDETADRALILAGAILVAAAFGLALRRLVWAFLPGAVIGGLGMLAAEIARERLMVRPETASLLFLALFLTIL